MAHRLAGISSSSISRLAKAVLTDPFGRFDPPLSCPSGIGELLFKRSCTVLAVDESVVRDARFLLDSSGSGCATRSDPGEPKPRAGRRDPPAWTAARLDLPFPACLPLSLPLRLAASGRGIAAPGALRSGRSAFPLQDDRDAPPRTVAAEQQAGAWMGPPNNATPGLRLVRISRLLLSYLLPRFRFQGRKGKGKEPGEGSWTGRPPPDREQRGLRRVCGEVLCELRPRWRDGRPRSEQGQCR
ncbi:Hypothetical predicted protein [Podarcis lilfordi]|uniref:Uncharacterized protein n=1 Tax=Podarcis lilfordi TaxID=74358 RepID=A0AA35P283_9SAUR|nr:Hypothetical predicted protein [Podarcis lilfordi]